VLKAHRTIPQNQFHNRRLTRLLGGFNESFNSARQFDVTQRCRLTWYAPGLQLAPERFVQNGGNHRIQFLCRFRM
jgi:hypothetical protein